MGSNAELTRPLVFLPMLQRSFGGRTFRYSRALSAAISKYLGCLVAADQGEVEDFFSNFVPRSRVKESINALLSARELSFIHVGKRSLLQVTPAKQPYVPRVRPQQVGG